jgi:DNA-binding NtrC family response regulator
MLEHPWTGNVRELKRVIEQAAVSCKESVLGPDAVAQAIDERRGTARDALPREYPESGNFPVARSPAFEPEPITRASPVNVDDLGLNELQQRLILDAYESNARNLTKAAKALRIPRTTLRDRLKRYGCL